LSFEPNRVNAKAHSGAVSWRISIDDIHHVDERSGFLTRILDVRSKSGSVATFRCFGAQAFARQIEAAARTTDL
jgi:hypothetical protein